jgi:hypothetical protein
LPFKCNLHRYTKGEVGRLSVDVMGLKELDAPATTFAVVGLCTLNSFDP